MLREVACHQGKCREVKKEGYASFDDMFEDEDIVSKIYKDLWKENLIGTKHQKEKRKI